MPTEDPQRNETSSPAAGGSSGNGRTGSRRSIALHWQIILGLVIGAAGGLLVNVLSIADTRFISIVRGIAEPVGQIFLRLIFMVVVPLVFCRAVPVTAVLTRLTHATG